MKTAKRHVIKSLLIGAIVLGSAGLAAAEAPSACNGGSCRTRNNVVLECPATGGPTCTEGQICVCRCSGNGQNTSATNQCLAARNPNPRTNEAFGFDLDAE